jgi:hypothetical protein
VEKAIEAENPKLGITIHRDEIDFRKAIGFDYQIQDSMELTSVLLCIVSASYLLSTYCQIEIECFVGRPKPGSLIRVLKHPVSITSQPEALQNLDGFKFHDEGGKPFPVFSDSNRVSSHFDDAVMPLAREIVRAVKQARAPRQRVLLLAAPERTNERQRILNDLKANQMEVLSEDQLPRDRRELRDLLNIDASSERARERIDFVILLLGSDHVPRHEEVYDAMTNRCAGPEKRCLCSPSSFKSKVAAQVQFLRRVRDLGAPPGYVCLDDVDAEVLLNEAKRYLRALQPKLDRTPTLFLSYPKSARGFADTVRDELRNLNRVLAPDNPLHLADAYGDGDAASLKTQTETRDVMSMRAHGGLLLQEKPGAFLAAALQETESFLLPKRTGKPIAVYPASAQAVVPGPILQKYPAIVREGSTPYPFIGSGALKITLTTFLQSVYAQAAAP